MATGSTYEDESLHGVGDLMTVPCRTEDSSGVLSWANLRLFYTPLAVVKPVFYPPGRRRKVRGLALPPPAFLRPSLPSSRPASRFPPIRPSVRQSCSPPFARRALEGESDRPTEKSPSTTASLDGRCQLVGLWIVVGGLPAPCHASWTTEWLPPSLFYLHRGPPAGPPVA